VPRRRRVANNPRTVSTEAGRGSRVAVAGIAATALVGIVATIGGWLVARDDRAVQRALAREDRATQRALAHDERIYDKRAAAYVSALVLMDQQRDELDAIADRLARKPKFRRELENRRPQLARDRAVYARIRAFGSEPAIDVYVRLRVEALGLWREALAHPASPDVSRFRDLENAFARMARRELYR
jgi:hypothetical protein